MIESTMARMAALLAASFATGVWGGSLSWAQEASTSSSEEFRRQVEADWLRRERYRPGPDSPGGGLTTRIDAAGGCDGVIDGGYGFHTGQAEDPWWQVDLGARRAIGRIVVWNRTDGSPERADHLRVLLSDDGREWRMAFANPGERFYGHTDGKPLCVPLDDASARFVRLQGVGKNYLHLDEVEVFGREASDGNLALDRPAEQVSLSPWSTWTPRRASLDWESQGVARVREIVAHGWELAAELESLGLDVETERADLERVERECGRADPRDVGETLYLEARWIQRRLTLAHPILDFDELLFAKRVPGSFNHMSDQYLGWWSRPGGGLYLLRNFAGGIPRAECITAAPLGRNGSFLRPTLSFDGERVLFAWCRHHPGLAEEQDKLNKDNVPEDAFYHLFEMNVDGSGLRQLTHGKYDDFDGRYLPDGRIVFLSTRRGQFVQCGQESALRTLETNDLPDAYVRCGGGPERPCAVYTLHTMDADGRDLYAISPFEMFEWTPSVAHDGTILYSRWDYIDRDNMPYMSLWAINPDGTNARIVYGNGTRAPHCTFEPQSIPGSSKIVFTASAHHAQTKGSLVLLDPAQGTEGTAPLTRLTPEVPFPEIEGWPLTYYANPWPLSERFHLVTWSDEGIMRQGQSTGWDRWHSVLRPENGTGLYLFDARGNMELLYRDPEISSMYPLPLRPRPLPFPMASGVDLDGPREGSYFIADVREGLSTEEREGVRSLRIIAVPPKTHPVMNYPNLGLTRDDPGKCVLGTVPVETDGSAYFRVPSGVTVFFQALDSRGMALQTMRSTTHVQPGQTLSCIGCHEPRTSAPPVRVGRPLALSRPPSKITPGPSGSWPLRFDRLVQPLLDRKCVECHRPAGADPAAAAFDLTESQAYESLVHYGTPSLHDHVWQRYREGASREGACAARRSPLLALLASPEGHQGVALDEEERERLILWMDTYAQRIGSFDEDQERRLLDLRREAAPLLNEE